MHSGFVSLIFQLYTLIYLHIKEDVYCGFHIYMALGAELLVLQGPVGDGEGGALSAALQQGAREQGSSGGDGSRRKGGGSEGKEEESGAPS